MTRKKVTKTKNIRLRRQIRKTIGALFMASAVTVAALPVQDVRAVDPTTAAGHKVQVLNYSDSNMKSYEALKNDTGANLSSVESVLRSAVPFVDTSATIYTTGDGMFQFAFVKPSATAADEVAVILGANVTSLPGNSLTIPKTVDAYKKYTANTTSTGYCAVSRKGEYLYYMKSVQKEDDSHFPLYSVPALKGTADDKEYTTFQLVKKGEAEDGTVSYVFQKDNGKRDDDGNIIYDEYAAVPIMIDSCVPCYYSTMSEWQDLADNQMYYWAGSGDVDSTKVDQFNLSSAIENQRIHDADVQYIGRQYLVPNTSTADGASEWMIGGLVTETNPEAGVFAGKGQIVNLTVGDNLLGIGDYAFYGCSGLNSVELGNGLSTIGNSAFADCVNMQQCNMQLNSQIQAIGAFAFNNCRGLTNMVIPVNVRAIGDYCFAGCDGLTNIDLCGQGSNVLLSVIGYNAFENCSRLTSVTFPDNYTDFETSTVKDETSGDVKETGIPISYFNGCTSLQFMKVQNGTFTLLEDTHAPALTCDIGVFLKSVPSIFYFEGPDGSAMHKTARRHSAAFKYLDEDKFEKAVWCPERKYDDDGNVIPGKEGHEAIFIVDSSNTLIDMILDKDCSVIEIPANIGSYGIDNIGSTSFQNNCILKKIIIPSTVKTIASNAFKGCHNLQDVIFSKPVNITSIGTGAFDTQNVDLHKTDCTNKNFLNDTDSSGNPKAPVLTFTGEISPDSVPFQFAMDPNNNINAGKQPKTYITFYSGWPTNLVVRYNQDTDKNELIDYPRYDEISTYTEGTYPDMTEDDAEAAKKAADAYNQYIVGSDPNLRPTDDQMSIVNAALNINLPAGIESIKTGIFSGVKADEDGEPEEITGDTNCKVNTDVQTITMNTVEDIEPYTFKGCTGLNGFYSSGGNSIGDYAFDECEKLTSVSIGASVSELGKRPFRGCENLLGVSFNDGPNFVCENGVIYGLSGGTKDSIVECLEARGKQGGVGSYSVGPEELAGITSIKEEAFMDCGDIGKADLSQTTVDTIPENCFKNTADLNSVVLPDTVKNIEAGSFQNSGVRLVTIPGNQAYIEKNAFKSEPTQQMITFECVEGMTADRYAKAYDYINPEYGKVYLTHTVYFWDYPDYPDITKEEIFDKVKVNDGEDAVPPTKTPEHVGYQFNRWTDYTNIVRDTDVYPIFGNNIYAVSFRDYDGSLIGEVQYIEEGKSATPPANPTREGYTFDKWSQDWNNVTEDRTIIALYTDNSSDASRHTVIFYDYDGTTVISQQSVNDGEAAVEPKSPTRSGYTFTGWVPKDFTKVTKDMNIVASYEKNSDSNNNNNGNNGNNSSKSSASPSPTASPGAGDSTKKYTVSVSGGSGSGSYAAGAVVAINAYFMGEGQTFDKWTTSTAGVGFANASASSTTFTMPAANVAITATYKAGKGTAATGSGGSGSNGGSSNSSNGTANTGNNSGTVVEITKPGVSNTGLAGATVTGATDNFVVKITEDQSATDAVTAALQAEYGDISRIQYFPMDISLYDSTGRTKIADTTGISVNITMPIPDELVQYAGNNKAGAVANGSLEGLGVKFTTVNGVPCINFTATHFSPYTIYVNTADLTASGTIDATPKTGDPIHPKWFLAIGMACISLVLFFKKDRVYIKKAG